MKKIWNKFLSFMFLILSTQAFALPDIFSPEAKDTDYLIHKILKPIFGYDMGFDYTESPFSVFSQVFLSGLVVIAAILLMFYIVQGTMDTSNSGQIMGGKASLTWTTLRSMVGVAILMPMGKAGLCAIQYIVLYLAAQGVLFADSAWEKFASDPFKGNVFIGSGVKNAIMKNVEVAFMSELCLQSAQMNSGTTNAAGKNYNWGRVANLKFNEKYGEGMASYVYGDQNENSTLNGICGKLAYDYDLFPIDLSTYNGISVGNEININSNSKLTLNQRTDFEREGKELFERNTVNTNIVKNEIMKQHSILTDEMVQKEIPNIVKNYLRNRNSANIQNQTTTAIQNLIESYITKLKQSYSSSRISNISEEMIAYMKRDGIASAGSWFFKIAADSNKLDGVLNTVPKLSVTNNITEINLDDTSWFGDKTTGEKLSAINNTIISDLKVGKEFLDSATRNVKIGLYSNSKYKPAKKLTGENALEEASATMVSYVSEPMDKSFAYDPIERDDFVGNPLIAIQNFGNSLINYSTSGLGVVVALIVFAPNSLATVITPIISAIVFSIIVPAFMMAYYIPLIPFILWVGALFGWLVLIVEALFGAPMWAVTFLSPDRDGFVGKTGQGYMLILSLTMRPVLMVLGYISALHLLTPVIRLINEFYGLVYTTLKTSLTAASALFFFVAALVIYVIIVNKTVVQIFGLIHKIPDSLLQWIGGGHGNVLGSYSQGIEGGVSNASVGALMGANQIGQAVSNAAKSAKENHNRKTNMTGRDAKALEGSISNQREMGEIDKQINAIDEKMKEMAKNSPDGAYLNTEEYKGLQNNKDDLVSQKETLFDYQKVAAGIRAMDMNGTRSTDIEGNFQSAAFRQFLQDNNMTLKKGGGFFDREGHVSKNNLMRLQNYLAQSESMPRVQMDDNKNVTPETARAMKNVAKK